MESAYQHHAARALLDWQIELGATEAICDAPVDRYGLPASLPKPAAAGAPAGAPAGAAAPRPAPAAPDADPVAAARAAAGAADSLEALRAALASFEGCDLRRGARNLVFADGNADASVMIIGEAPGREEDREGRPFVGRAGQLLDRMLAAIGMARDATDPAKSVYITNILPWRPPQNRDPKPDEIAMMLPFMQRHVDLVAPDIIVLMGNISCQAGLGRRGITRLRGNWTESYGKPTLPMFHPAYLLRTPYAKREAWADLLELQARLRGNA
ncbi:MAG: uracil-DNA glycosylase [Pseudomonadota bacterium]|uniref:uracil-DNA glycosylase n=1 Tax=Roseovarius TaxID=74030 RepID=UPI0022A89B76|nr:uracil-DNA glycosylase [Roseovarius sp. EGI FJ00037]MCZ0813224.1 uracil-DNA glycosylase [Roseovarius sp. EGI FJ00037]